jgi:ribosomal peptide maturation radical SAM protein 1
MPFSTISYPCMAFGSLKPSLLDAGIPCDVRYLLLEFADRIGYEAQETLTDGRYYKALVGDWVFAGLAAEGPGLAPAPDDLSYLTDFFAREYPEHHTASRAMTFLAARAEAQAFLDECVSGIDWGAYAAVGFTTSFQQNMASLALARRVKERFPGILTVFGGANCRGEMGVEMHRRYPFIDAVCLEEGERAFPALVRRHLDGADLAGVPGFVLRRGGETVEPEAANDPVVAMDELPYPDFSDFYEQHARSEVARTHYPPAVLFETSRGCWWGAKHHCTFCGINGAEMAYRSKSQGRAYEELAYLAGRYGRDFVNVDSILDPKYFRDFIPRLAREGPDVTIYYELKANLKPEQMRLLGAAGIRKIQPGIESLDTGILALMRKGCTMLQNVQTLKLAAENGLFVEWNLLYGFPGETPEQYERMARLIPMLVHLQPPALVGRVRADRFSPYHGDPGSFGVTVDPAPAYRYVYPFEDAVVRRLAYHFDIGSAELGAAEEYVRPVKAVCAAWCENLGRRALFSSDEGDRVVVTDERASPGTVLELDGAEAAVYRACGTIVSRARLRDELAHRFPAAAIDRAVDGLVARAILLGSGDEILALPLRQPGFRTARPWDQVRQTPKRPVAESPPALVAVA